jgi:hypothetical protein
VVVHGDDMGVLYKKGGHLDKVCRIV